MLLDVIHMVFRSVNISVPFMAIVSISDFYVALASSNTIMIL